MERNLTVTVTGIATAAEECVTPRDPGSRIPPATVCPPAPRKRPAGFYTEDDDLDGTTGLPARNLSRRFSKVAIRLVFDVVEFAEPTEKRTTTTTTITDSHHGTTHNDHTSDC